jgi:hypothetical protein
MKEFKHADIREKSVATIKKEMADFENEKNKKAAFYTILSFSMLLLLFFVKNFPPPPPEIVKKNIEPIPVEIDDDINLGNDINGALGDLQPLQKGDFAPPEASKSDNTNTPAESDNADPEPPVRPMTDETKQDANVINTPAPSPRPPGRNPNPNPTTPRPTANPRPTASPAPSVPAPPRPRATMGTPRQGGTGNGNGADRDRFGNDGNGLGTGDRGNQGGTVNGSGGVVSNRTLTNLGTLENLASQSGTNYKGKANIKVRVNEDGRVTSVLSINMVPASAESRDAKNYVRDVIAPKLKFQPGADGRTGTVTIDFDY